MKAKTSADRTGGFQGAAEMIYVVSNTPNDALTVGHSIVKGNICTNLNRDASNGVGDFFILTDVAGQVSISDNILNGQQSSIVHGSVMRIGQNNDYGAARYSINNNMFGSQLAGYLIHIYGGGTISEVERKIKHVSIQGNVASGMARFVHIDSSGTYPGVISLDVTNNNISLKGHVNATTAYGVVLNTTAASGDIVRIRGNKFDNIGYANSGAFTNGTVEVFDNKLTNITNNATHLNYWSRNNGSVGIASFTAGQNVQVSSGSGKGYFYTYEERSSTGAYVSSSSGFNFGVSTLTTVGAGNVGVLRWEFVGSLL